MNTIQLFNYIENHKNVYLCSKTVKVLLQINTFIQFHYFVEIQYCVIYKYLNVRMLLN
jgi:hypothetical protein